MSAEPHIMRIVCMKQPDTFAQLDACTTAPNIFNSFCGCTLTLYLIKISENRLGDSMLKMAYLRKLGFVLLVAGEASQPLSFRYPTEAELSDLPHDVVAFFDEDSDEPGTPSNDGPPDVPPHLNQVISPLRQPKDDSLLWIEQLCSGNGAIIRRKVVEEARRVIIWAGPDGDADEDAGFDAFIGPGNSETTESAFLLVQSLQEKSSAAILEALMLDTTNDGTTFPQWAYVLRILCRPFFRRLPLLRTNYAAELLNASVQCGNSVVRLRELQHAAAWIWTIFPIPHFLRGHVGNHSTKDLLEASKSLIKLLEDFGWESAAIQARLVHMASLTMDEEGPERIFAFLEYSFDVRSAALDRMKEETSKITRFQADPVAVIEQYIRQDGPHFTPASLPFDCVQYQAPKAIEQAPFIHPLIDLDSPSCFLLLLMPGSHLSDPVQCGLVETNIEDAPDFEFVINSAVLRPPVTRLSHKNFPGISAGVTTRRVSAVLLNGQAIMIPSLQELFLRLYRDSEEPKFLFLWNLCMGPKWAGTGSELEFPLYFKKMGMLKQAISFSTLDMYSVLDNTDAERAREVLEYFGQPEDTAWDEFLLGLNE